MSDWIAEDVAWHSVSREGARPGMTDEGHAMSGPVHLGRFPDRTTAGRAAAEHLLWISGFESVTSAGDRDLYSAAADAMLAGADGVRISGRFYRVRED